MASMHPLRQMGEVFCCLSRETVVIILEFTFNAIAEFEEQQRFNRIRLAEFELPRLAEFELQHRF